MSYEYKVIPAPTRGLKAKGVKTAEDRFANALETEMNALAAKGWEYLRTDTLPSEQREGLMSKTTVYQNMLVFRRAKQVDTVRTAVLPTKEPMVSSQPLKTGAERLAEKKLLVTPKPATPPAAPKTDADTKPDPDLAAE